MTTSKAASITFKTPEGVDVDLEAGGSVAAALTKATQKRGQKEGKTTAQVVEELTGPAEEPTAKAKRLVVENYNAHHDRSRTPPLTAELLKIVWFSQSGNNWRAVLESSVVRGMRYEISYNGRTGEAFIDVYKKINNEKVAA
jgi:Family of unknown function (DUF6275)